MASEQHATSTRALIYRLAKIQVLQNRTGPYRLKLGNCLPTVHPYTNNIYVVLQPNTRTFQYSVAITDF